MLPVQLHELELACLERCGWNRGQFRQPVTNVRGLSIVVLSLFHDLRRTWYQGEVVLGLDIQWIVEKSRVPLRAHEINLDVTVYRTCVAFGGMRYIGFASIRVVDCRP